MYGSDIRSMINYLQTNQYILLYQYKSEVWETLYTLSLKESLVYVEQLSVLHNMDPKHILKEYVYYLALQKSISISSLELVFHTTLSNKVMIQYVLFIIN